MDKEKKSWESDFYMITDDPVSTTWGGHGQILPKANMKESSHEKGKSYEITFTAPSSCRPKQLGQNRKRPDSFLSLETCVGGRVPLRKGLYGREERRTSARQRTYLLQGQTRSGVASLTRMQF